MKNTRNPISLLRALRAIVLPLETKTRVRAELSAYADLHELADVRPRQLVRSPFASFILPARSLYAGALTLLLMVAGGTQASFAAEDAVPGDILYPIKVALSEPLSLVLTPSTEGKAELAARFASRRVDEAATLSSVGKLDEKTAEELADRFDSHVDVVAKETAALESKGEISTSLAVRTDLEQKLSERVEEFAVREGGEGTVMMASLAADTEVQEPAGKFSARVVEKSKTLATTRERLENALALDVKAELEGGRGLAAIRGPELGADVHLFFATTVATDTATSTATTTATSTEEGEVSEPAASRFFMPFMPR